jgi:hypothetical protein
MISETKEFKKGGINMNKVRFNLPKEIVEKSKLIKWSEGEGELDVNTGVLTIKRNYYE